MDDMIPGLLTGLFGSSVLTHSTLGVGPTWKSFNDAVSRLASSWVSLLFQHPIQAMSDLTSLLTTVLTLGLALVGAIVAALAAWRLIVLMAQRLGHRMLVVSDFVNGSGDSDIDKALIGLSTRAREMLDRDMANIQADARRNAESSEVDLHRSPLPQSTNLDNVSLMTSAIAGVTSSNVSAVVNLLNILFAPKGTKVATTLQLDGNPPGRLGMTFVVGEATGGDDASRTFWESRRTPTSPEVARDSTTGDTLSARYSALLVPAMRQVSIELARRELLRKRSVRHRLASRVPYLSGKLETRQYTAKLYNYVGRQYQVAGMQLGTPYDTVFYRNAIEEYERAIDCDDAWYRPYENLADTYSLLALRSYRLGGDLDLADAARHYRRALDHYDIALTHMGAGDASDLDSQDIDGVTEQSGSEGPGRHDGTDPIAVHRWRVQLGKVMALLPSARFDLSRLDANTVAVLEEVRHNWHRSAKPDARVLYSLAACHALAYRMGTKEVTRLHDAQRYVTCAGVLKWQLMAQACYDPHFEACWEDFDLFRSSVDHKRKELQRLFQTDFDRFQRTLDLLLDELNQDQKSGETVSATG